MGLIREYDKNYCWQYNIRLTNKDSDIKELPFWIDSMGIENVNIDDFIFSHLTDDIEIENAQRFIKKHEWLGTTAYGTTHWFGAYYQCVLAGVITMGCPAAFSNIMGDDTKNIERLISRGACISWSPKNLASKFIMWCIRWMVNNTQYRLFTAYSDPQAKELGTIYQSCNFYYLGNSFGETHRYVSPYSGDIVSSRTFRSRSYYKKYAQDLGIQWQSNWSIGDKVLFENIPNNIEEQLREYQRKIVSESTLVSVPSKHKYAYVLGRSKLETKRLRRKLEELNTIYEYPKDRGK